MTAQPPLLGNLTCTDPFLHLEDLTSVAVVSWLERRRVETASYLSVASERDAIVRMLDAAESTGRIQDVRLRNGLLFYSRIGSSHEWPVVARCSAEGDDDVLLSSELVPGGLPIVAWSPSPDGRYIAFQTAPRGAETGDLLVWDTAERRVIDGPLGPCRYAVATWLSDQDFVYVQLPPDGIGRRVLVHQLRASSDDDQLLFEARCAGSSLVRVCAGATAQGDLVAVTESVGFDGASGITVLSRPSPHALFAPRARITGIDGIRSFALIDGRLVVLRADRDDRRNVLVIDPGDPVTRRVLPVPVRGIMKQVLPARIDENTPGVAVLAEDPCGDDLVVGGLDGMSWIRPPGLVAAATSVEAVNTDETGTLAVTTSSWSRHRSVHVRGHGGRTEQLLAEESKCDVECTALLDHTRSVDGTKIGLTVLQERATEGPAPTLMTCYGGFGISINPQRSPFALTWVRAGGRFVVVDVRGGAGQGRHDAGRRHLKHNALEDFAAAARWIVSQELATPNGLGSIGASNGGMVAAAAAVRYPALWKAIAITSAVLDMVRFHRHGMGRYWIDEYGSPDDPDDLAILLQYSPYHQIRPEVTYPAMLISYFEDDDRVSPIHSVKFAARLEETAANGDPHLLNPIPNGGHHLRATASVRRWDVDRLVFLGGKLGLQFAAAGGTHSSRP